ncbi:MAG TPA: DUF4232 domain-containing protein [Verrucomicrobiae bacterium]|nr:DUF4232 domain-containing protein [Verrucomicrobiae bacterium]
MDPESLLRERLARLAARPLPGSVEERVLSRTTRRSAARGSRLLAMGAALSTALVVGGVLYGVASIGRHPVGTRPPQGAGHRTPVPSRSQSVPTPPPTPSPTPTPVSRPRRSARPTPTVAAAVPPTPTPTPTASAAAPSARAVVRVATCLGRQLTLTVRPGPRSARMAAVVYILENVGGATCTLRGVPTVRLVGAGGASPAMVPVRAGHGPGPLVSLRPGGRASFVLLDLGCRQTTSTVADPSLALEVRLPGPPVGPALLVRGGLVCAPRVVEVSAITRGVATPRLAPGRGAAPSAPATPIRRPRPTPTPSAPATSRPTRLPAHRATPSATPTATARPTPASSPRATPRPAPTETPIPLATPTPTAMPLCTPSDLRFALYSGPISSQATSVALGLSNGTASACLFVGLPSLTLVLGGGSSVPVAISSVSYNPAAELVLAPLGEIGAQSAGAVIVLDLQWPASSLGCPPAAGVALTLQYLGSTLTLHDAPVPVCAGASNITAQLQAFGS